MTDILPDIAELLETAAPVELSFHDGYERLPVIVLSLLENISSVVLSGAERYSRIGIQLDIYDEDAENAQLIACIANDILIRKGLKRSFSQLITDEDTPRMCMRYSFGLDVLTGRVVAL